MIRCDRLGDLRIVDLANGSDHLLGVDVQGPIAWRPDVGGTPPYRFAFSDGINVRIGSAMSDEPPPILANGAQSTSGPAWSSAGQIAFYAETIGGNTLVIDSEDGADSVSFGTSYIVEAGPPVFTPDGTWVATVVSGHNAVTLIDPRDPENIFHEVAGTNGARFPRFSFDGKWLSFASDRAGGQGDFDLWMVPFDPVAGAPTGAAFNLTVANSPASERAAYWSR